MIQINIRVSMNATAEGKCIFMFSMIWTGGKGVVLTRRERAYDLN